MNLRGVGLVLSWTAASGVGVFAGVAATRFVTPHPTSPPASAAPPSPSTPEEWAAAGEQASARHLELRRRFDEEARDPAWSPEAAATFRRDFDALGSRIPARVTGVDCRTTMCKVDLAWASYTEAKRGYRAVIGARYQLKCLRDIYVPRPEVEAATYAASVVFDCAASRKDG